MAGPVVVGVDSTPSSERALIWGAQAAADRHTELHLVHAIGYPSTALDLLEDEVVAAGAADLVAQAADRVRESWPALPVRTHVDRTTAANALGERSRHATLVVVGAQRLTGLAGVISGSLSYGIAAAAWCPVAVVPSLPAPEATGVVVGVDGSSDGLQAVRLAAAAADRTGDALHVVHAWQEPGVYLSADYYIPETISDRLEQDERLVLAESVAGLADRYPDLLIQQHLVQGQPAAALLDQAENARLLVVGSRGRGGLVRALLGSVSHTVVQRATCPVLITRTREHEVPPHH
ncbi:MULTISPECIES: universal stress protein [unclassified Actinotalea]|uniref:universal stress protein n=1 Tax=unclassified Actinotalea TaxID=2638618 RepID=UPI0015F6EAE1|nr:MULTISPECIES: universal stress protein [unclassified Actinotalea]